MALLEVDRGIKEMNNLPVDDQRLAIEIISTLAYVKSTMVELILKPAGVPPAVYVPLLHQRNEATGRELSKREMAPLILRGLEGRSDGGAILASIVRIAAQWTAFHLAHDEYAARATVEKARDRIKQIDIDTEQARIREQELVKMKRVEEEREFEKQLGLLLMMFDEMCQQTDHQKRGYLLQDLLNRLFDLHGIPVYKSFVRNSGAEQIDGAFKLDGWYYLVECRWREKLADARDLDGLSGQVGRSGRQTLGVFLSINAWSDLVPSTLKQNPEKSIVLMEGYDLRCVLDGSIGLLELLDAKFTKLNIDSEPFYSARSILERRRAAL